VLGLWILCLAGCRAVATPSPIDITVSATATANPITSSTEMPTAQITNTLIPTPSQTATGTPIPVLPTKEARMRLLTLLSNNDSCQLPCLWRIIPGESSFNDAIKILMPLSGIAQLSAFYNGLGTIEPQYIENNLTITTSIAFLTKNNMITLIVFRARAMNSTTNNYLYDSNIFGEILSYYSLSNILEKYGRPSTVLINTPGGPSHDGSWGPFNILLIFPDLGILANYETRVRASGMNVLGCPVNAHIQLYLYPSGNGSSFMESIAPSWHDRLPSYEPLEKVTDMSIDQFYQTFRQPSDKCLVTPLKYWPTIQP
jgi:hypothetical protein